MKRRIIWVCALAAVVLISAVAFWLWPKAPQPLPPQVGPVPELGTNATSLDRLEQAVNDMGVASGSRKLHWNVSYMSETDSLDTRLLDAAAGYGVTHHIVTLEIRHGLYPGLLKSIAAGQIDGQLRTIATQMYNWQQANPDNQLILRPLHEANGDWYPWGFVDGHNGNAAADFVPAWNRIRSVMRSVFPGLPFFWCPNRLYGGQTSFTSWYPGDSQVEYVGDDGYNRSQSNGYFSWETPREVHEATIRAIRDISPSKPYIIGETATSEPAWGAGLAGHTKAEWFKQFGEWMTGFTRHFGIVAVCYFDYDKREENGNDWRIFPDGEDSAYDSYRAFLAATRDLP